MKSTVKIVEVGPRDGLQNEKQPIDVDTKVGLIERLAAAGLKHIEAASFVSPKWVPQMAGSAEVMARLQKNQGVRYSALTPNLQGLEAAMAGGCKEIAVFGAASETFSQRNINCSIRESVERFRSVVEMAVGNNLLVRGYVSCVLGLWTLRPESSRRCATCMGRAPRLSEVGEAFNSNDSGDV